MCFPPLFLRPSQVRPEIEERPTKWTFASHFLIYWEIICYLYLYFFSGNCNKVGSGHGESIYLKFKGFLYTKKQTNKTNLKIHGVGLSYTGIILEIHDTFV